MLDLQEAQDLCDEIGALSGQRLEPQPSASAGGGSVTRCWRWQTNGSLLFVKLAARGALAMLEAEAAGLTELAATRTVRTPAIHAVGFTPAHAFLALEWLELRTAGEHAQSLLGERLAKLHRAGSDSFGWQRDNTIGATPQVNTPSADWLQFFRDYRLFPQLELAVRNGHGAQLAELGEQLLERFEDFFTGYRARPSLLHGDLWGGNWAADAAGDPVIFDPAVYYGDREADIAMTRLFGGFGARFYAAYEAAWPLAPGHGLRAQVYNLYHVLNHANLFGGHYVEQAQHMLQRLLGRET